MDDRDRQRIALVIGKKEPSLFSDYLDCVAHEGLTKYKAILQWGKKAGESLYTHVLNGILVLETLRKPLELSDTESRVLYAAFTVHDINKVLDRREAFGKLATRESIAAECRKLLLPDFFPEWETYLPDIESLVRGHSGHYHAGGERLIVKRGPVYALGLDRVNALLHLMRAADVVDLSQTLEERAIKADVVGYINTYLADSGKAVQYEFFTHRLTELRGILTNVFHNCIAGYLQDRHSMIPLLFYPDGIAYLVRKGEAPTIGDADLAVMSKRAAGAISQMTESKFRDFVTPTGQGIKVDAKCLALGVPFRDILREIYNLAQRRNPDPVELDAKVRDRAQRGFEKAKECHPETAAEVQAALGDTALQVSESADRLRQAELIRAYYIFLNKHFRSAVADPWARIYRLLSLPETRDAFYSYFDPLWDRAYVLSRDLMVSDEKIFRRIETDGEALLAGEEQAADPKEELFASYLKLYVLFEGTAAGTTSFGEHLAHYVANQHSQCVYCSGPFPTGKWMSGDVRSDITVQAFSNRLRGGPGEPKKHICAVCQVQFLLEKLDYPQVRGEKTFYLHLYPYSFLTRPFLEGLSATIGRIVSEDAAVQALNMNVIEGVRAYVADRVVTPTFRTRTKKDRPQPYGLYLPRYSETVGNLLIFPINPAGQNDTERFLFALWNALLLQRHFGVKVLMSNAAVPALGKEQIPDLYIDNIPLACQGLLPRNDYSEFSDGSQEPGTLPGLWDDVADLFALRRLTFTRSDNTPRLVRALARNPLTIFFETDRLLEARLRGQQPGGLSTWLTQQSFTHVQRLALSKGGQWMAELSTQLERLAGIAWQGGLRGRTLERSSLLYPVGEVFAKLAQSRGHADRATVRAATVQDIFDHLYRIAPPEYKPGKKKWQATKGYVDLWYDGVLEEVYGGNLRKLLTDEKLIRSAYLFYVREEIPRKAELTEDADEAELGEPEAAQV